MNDDKIRISPDALIAMIVTEAQDRELAQMPSLEEMNEDFQPSEKFQRKMEALVHDTKRKAERKKRLLGIKRFFITHLRLLFPFFHVPCSPSRLCAKLLSQRLLNGTISLYRLYILKFLVLPPPIMDTHMSFLVQLISNPVPLTS